MRRGYIEVICGEGTGKTALALGKGLGAVTARRNVIMIQFLKGCARQEEMSRLRCLEPELKVFRFEKADAFFENLTEEEKAEERSNIRNGFNFAKKVIATGECDLLILDEILGTVSQGIVSMEEFENFLRAKDEEMSLLLTGRDFPAELASYVDVFTTIQHVDARDESLSSAACLHVGG